MEASSRDDRRGDEVEWFIQRGKRGWANCDVWSLHSYLSEVIRGTIHQLSLYNQPPGDMSSEDWYMVLRDIENGFDAFEKMEEVACPKSSNGQWDNWSMEFERGMDLLKEHYFYLWC